MTLFQNLRKKLQRHLIATYQGIKPFETLTTRELLRELCENDRVAYQHLMTDMFTHQPDPEREAMIREQRQRDHIDFDGDSSLDTSCRFDQFVLDPDIPTLLLAFDAAGAWAHGLGPYLVTLSGPPGVGKTHLALAAAREVMEHDHPIIYRTEKGLLDQLHQAMRKDEDGLAGVMQEVAEIPWLVLDDLGAGAVSEWDKTHIDQLINARWQGIAAQLRTLVTTNLVGSSLSPRIASRLGDVHNAKAILIRAPDYRRQA